jgi:hypothetical protein
VFVSFTSTRFRNDNRTCISAYSINGCINYLIANRICLVVQSFLMYELSMIYYVFNMVRWILDLSCFRLFVLLSILD